MDFFLCLSRLFFGSYSFLFIDPRTTTIYRVALALNVCVHNASTQARHTSIDPATLRQNNTLAVWVWLRTIINQNIQGVKHTLREKNAKFKQEYMYISQLYVKPSTVKTWF